MRFKPPETLSWLASLFSRAGTDSCLHLLWNLVGRFFSVATLNTAALFEEFASPSISNIAKTNYILKSVVVGLSHRPIRTRSKSGAWIAGKRMLESLEFTPDRFKKKREIFSPIKQRCNTKERPRHIYGLCDLFGPSTSLSWISSSPIRLPIARHMHRTRLFLESVNVAV